MVRFRQIEPDCENGEETYPFKAQSNIIIMKMYLVIIMIYSGKGVTAAVLDTGINPHMDFDHRIVYFKDFLKGQKSPYDDNGHGTHVAGILAGSGAASLGKYKGVAPGCNIVALKILDQKGLGNSENLIKSIQWLIENHRKYGIRIVNISVGGINSEENNQKAINAYADRLWEEGVVVVAAAGNGGPDSATITAPGSSCKVITVGSSDMIYEKKGASGRGPVGNCLFKPDIVAPGNRIISCSGRNSYMEKSGTSMSTPRVAGAIALLVEKEPELTNEEIKYRLCQTSDNLYLSRNIQGCGQLNIKKLLSFL